MREGMERMARRKRENKRKREVAPRVILKGCAYDDDDDDYNKV